MTDQPRYRDSEMEGQEALEYAYEELGNRIQETNSLPSHKVEKYWGSLRSVDGFSSFTQCKNGYVLQGVLEDQIINPKEIIGQNPRFWIKQDELIIYFKKEGDYYLLRLQTR